MFPVRKIFLILALLPFPAWADFGNRFVANQRLAVTLNGPGQKMAYRFTCQDDTSLTAAALYCLDSVSPPAYLVSLQEDEKGAPSGTPLSISTFAPHTQSWSTLPLNSVPLIKGKIYYLVVEQDTLRGGAHPVGKIGPDHYASFLSTDVLNHSYPNDGTPDPQANTLFFEKGKWKKLDQEPVYVVYGTGTNFQGNPYDAPGSRPIFGKVLQGQVLHFHCGYPLKALAFRVKKQGHPTAPLNYIIMAHDFIHHITNVLRKEKALEPGQAPADYQWVTIGTPTELPSFPAECYYFVFQTDSGKASSGPAGCEDCYLLSDVGHSGGLAHGSDLTFDGGAHLSRATCSLDGGDPAHWLDEFERDANVVAIGPVCPEPVSKQFTPLPTPVPFGQQERLAP